MQIGQLAAITGVPTKTIRYYEDIGVLPTPDRTPSGYRDYDEAASDRLLFVRGAQRAGLTLNEVRSIFEVRDEGQAPCGHVADLINKKLEEIDQRITALHRTRKELEVLADRANTLDYGACGPESICQIIIPSQ
ncbi:MAG: heavy metal-responsive transcriptional regulator [Acidimicrobiia bacterium]